MVFAILSTCFLKAQSDVEDNDNDQSQLNYSQTTVAFSLAPNVEVFKLKCEQPTYPEFSLGPKSFKLLFEEKVLNVADNGRYAVNGPFTFTFNVDKNGKMQNFEMKPMVSNAKFLYQDLKTAFKRLKGDWKPATCDGQPVDSKIRLKVNFRTDSFDF
jgi:hypothetical protein